MKVLDFRRSSFLLVPLMIGTSFRNVNSQVAFQATSFLLGGITNAASSAGNFLASAVEMPRSLLMNATKMTTNYIDSAASIGLDFKLRMLLDKFRSRMPYGFPELGVPVLEPLKLRDLNLETFHTEIGNVTLYLDNVTIDRLSSFNIDRARLSLIGPTITVNLSIPMVLTNGYYNISGIIDNMVPIHGAGHFEAVAHDFRIYFKTVLGYSHGMYMKSFDLDFSIKAADLSLENFMGGDESGTILTAVFKDLIPQAVEIIKPDILPPIQDFIASRANDTIYHLTMRDVLVFLVGEGDIRNYPLPLP
ncbi:uncharacterized protein [Venturia canescens]|uniref:uncharacterized protein isoform X2 n=1 Tax=Venturia canescens TaxID=32260 RepID=UPI001C9CC073|nr:uncharacterized protein LOC122419171 isoform X2 [Venturia canescens]